MVATCNVLLVLALYSLLRVGCYAVNTDIFPDVSKAHLWEMLCGGLRFDLTAVLYLSSLYIIAILLPLPAQWRNNAVYRKVLAWIFLVPNILGLIINTIDIVYIRFTDRRTTCTFFTEFANDNNLWQIVEQGIVEYWYVTIAGVVVLVTLCIGLRFEYCLGLPGNRQDKIRYYVRESVLFVATIYMCVIGIRGGFGRYTRPITISNAMQYTDTPRETALVLNTPFSLMKSLENQQYVEPQYFAAEELATHMSPIHEGGKELKSERIKELRSEGIKEGKSERIKELKSERIKELKNERVKELKNVVVIILESFSKEYIGFYNRDIEGYTGYTPFLDSLLAQSVTYRYSFASGRKSIDAMPSVLSSIPMLIEPYIVTPYSTNSVSSIADCLKQKGYQTAFFHGAPNGSMGFQAYARSAGFDQYYGMDEFGDKSAFDGTWAIWDEEFLQYYAQTMSEMKEPFMTSVFTASSHHPFKVPEKYEGVFPEGEIPIHKTIGYADYALRRFFETASQQPWYKNTLFVITADHTNQLTLAEYTNAKGLYEVPIAFYHPAWSEGELRTQGAISQTDIMPSVLNYVGYDETYFAFGEDALTQTKEHPYAVCYNAPLYQIMSDSLLVQFDGEKVVGVYDYRTDRLLKENIAASIEQEQIAPMEDYLKAYIQQYIHRMIHDELRVLQ